MRYDERIVPEFMRDKIADTYLYASNREEKIRAAMYGYMLAIEQIKKPKQCDACNAMCRIEGWTECWDLCTCKCHTK